MPSRGGQRLPGSILQLLLPLLRRAVPNHHPVRLSPASHAGLTNLLNFCSAEFKTNKGNLVKFLHHAFVA